MLYCIKLPLAQEKLREVIAAEFDHNPATNKANAELELFSETASIEKDLLFDEV